MSMIVDGDRRLEIIISNDSWDKTNIRLTGARTFVTVKYKIGNSLIHSFP